MLNVIGKSVKVAEVVGDCVGRCIKDRRGCNRTTFYVVYKAVLPACGYLEKTANTNIGPRIEKIGILSVSHQTFGPWRYCIILYKYTVENRYEDTDTQIRNMHRGIRRIRHRHFIFPFVLIPTFMTPSFFSFFLP